MTGITTLEIRKSDLSELRVTDTAAPAIQNGQVIVRIVRFGLTASNITYDVVGDRIGHWQFFPTAGSDWGVIPVWGFGIVDHSGGDAIAVGERLYGYWPMASHAILTPNRASEARFVTGPNIVRNWPLCTTAICDVGLPV